MFQEQSNGTKGVFYTCIWCIEAKFLKTLTFQCTLSAPTKKHKAWSNCLPKNPTELLDCWNFVVARQGFRKRAITPAKSNELF